MPPATPEMILSFVADYADPSTRIGTAAPANALPALTSDKPVSRPLLAAIAIALVVMYALLWSPWWYPLSDSSLYLNMARGLMQGKGFSSLRQIHRDVRPLTPLLLYAIMKFGGGIGAMHAVMIALTLLSHAL